MPIHKALLIGLSWSLVLIASPSWAIDSKPLTIINNANRPVFDKAEVTILGKTLFVEVAKTAKQREYGLMFKKRMHDRTGMLFAFPETKIHCFWMKNTLLPLTIVFLDEKLGIVDIQEMKPKSHEVHCPTAPIRYALEINKGWFKRSGFTAEVLTLTYYLHKHHFVKVNDSKLGSN